MLKFEKCCFCISLRTGCLILGYLHLVASIVLTIFSSIALAAVGTVMASRDVEINQEAANIAIGTTVILLLLTIVLLTFSILLIIGIYKEEKNYVKTYLVYYFIFIILNATLYIVKIATLPFDLGYVLGNLAEILLSVYFLLVIRSHWVTMCENSGNNFSTAYSARRSES